MIGRGRRNQQLGGRGEGGMGGGDGEREGEGGIRSGGGGGGGGVWVWDGQRRWGAGGCSMGVMRLPEVGDDGGDR